MIWHDPAKELPRDGKYVLVHYAGGNWHDDDDPDGINYQVAKFRRGLSQSERNALPGCDPRKHRYVKEDEHDNNLRPYCWDIGLADMYFFGHEVDRWAFIEDQSREEEAT